MEHNISSATHPYRPAGRAAIASGVIGIIAFAFLITAVTTRTQIEIPLFSTTYLLFKAHNVGVILQFILIIPVMFAFYKLSNLQPPGMSKLMLRIGVGAALSTALFLLLGIFMIISDGFYTVPQGVFGVWLIIVCKNTHDVISRGLRWFGIIVGLGLLITGMFFPLYAIFVNPIILQIPAVDPSDPANYPTHFTWANQYLHYLLNIGSVMGVLTLPFWTILIGRILLRRNDKNPLTQGS